MSFGEQLSSVRRRSGLTQEQFAEQLQVSRQAVSKWERGHPSSSGSSPKPAVSGSFFCKKCKTVTRADEVSVHGYLVQFVSHMNWRLGQGCRYHGDGVRFAKSPHLLWIQINQIGMVELLFV